MRPNLVETALRRYEATGEHLHCISSLAKLQSLVLESADIPRALTFIICGAPVPILGS